MFRRPRVKAINTWKECRPLALAEVHWRPTGNRVLSRSFGEFMADGTIFAATQHQVYRRFAPCGRPFGQSSS
jgi:hypothetical protein